MRTRNTLTLLVFKSHHNAWSSLLASGNTATEGEREDSSLGQRAEGGMRRLADSLSGQTSQIVVWKQA